MVLEVFKPPFEVLVLTACQRVNISPTSWKIGLGRVVATWLPGRPEIEAEILRIWVPPIEKARVLTELKWVTLPPGVALENFAKTVRPYWDIPQERLIAALVPILTTPGWERITIEVHAVGRPPKLYHMVTTKPRAL